jgi:hypothetical protein
MKTIILTGASLIALSLGGAAMAQEANTVNETTNPIAAAPTFTETAGFGNEAVVTQSGDGNEAIVDQTDSTGDGFASINQQLIGDNYAKVDQNGAGDNKASIDQASTTDTNGFVPAGEPGLPTDRDTPDRAPVAGASQTAVITQTNDIVGSAEANEASIRQGVSGVRGFANEARITQDGSNNTTTIEQGGGTNTSDGNMFSIVNQVGSDNVAQNRQGEADYSNIEQNGNGNTAVVDQNYIVGVIGRTSDVFQGGDDNQAEVIQTGSGASSSVLQGLDALSNNNLAFVEQASAATSLIEQGGLGNNEARTVQSASASGAMAFVDQIGQSNESLIMQTAASTARANQAGELGDSSIFQNGVGNTATLTQFAGSVNETSLITQNGTNGTVTVNQRGMNNVSEVLQSSGDLNMATVNQNGIGDFSTITQSGNGNTAMVTQGTN